MDEFIVDSRKVAHLLLRRRVLRLAALACLIPTVWCRQQQLLQRRHVLRWDAEAALLSSLGRWLALSARKAAYLPHLQPGATTRRRERRKAFARRRGS